jgi:heme exporter protein B
VLVPLGVGPEGGMLGRIAPGILWVGALLACLLSLDRIFALDHEDGSLDLLATAPIPLEAVVAVKALAHWLVTGLPLTLIAPGLAVLLNLPPAAIHGWSSASSSAPRAVGHRGLRRGDHRGPAARRVAPQPPRPAACTSRP